MTKFQIQIGGHWKDYDDSDDERMKKAFMAGESRTTIRVRGEEYVIDFKELNQINEDTGKTRKIRPPHGWKAPAPRASHGHGRAPQKCVKIQHGEAGTTIQVPHPDDPHRTFPFDVPRGTRAGMTIMVSVPPLEDLSPGPDARGGKGKGDHRGSKGGKSPHRGSKGDHKGSKGGSPHDSGSDEGDRRGSKGGKGKGGKGGKPADDDDDDSGDDAAAPAPAAAAPARAAAAAAPADAGADEDAKPKAKAKGKDKTDDFIRGLPDDLLTDLF